VYTICASGGHEPPNSTWAVPSETLTDSTVSSVGTSLTIPISRSRSFGPAISASSAACATAFVSVTVRAAAAIRPSRRK